MIRLHGAHLKKPPLTFATVLVLGTVAFDAVAAAEPEQPTYTIRPTRLGISYEELGFPNGKFVGGEERIGLMGANWNLDLGSNVFAGFGTYFAVVGNRGGFIGFGFQGGYRLELPFHVEFRPEAFVGGAGGVGTPGGGGLLFRPAFSLNYVRPEFSAGLGYAYTDTPTGTIHDRHPFAQLTFSSDILYSNWAEEETVQNWKLTVPESGHASRRWKITPGLKFYLARDGEDPVVKDAKGNLLHKTTSKDISLAGIGVDHYLGSRWFTHVSLFGAYSGAAGYMSLMFGAGYAYPLNERFSLAPRLNAGAGGGGGVDVGGGLVFEPSVELETFINESTDLHIGYGYFFATTGGYIAPDVTATIAIKLDTLETVGRADTISEIPHDRAYQPVPWRFSLSSQRYFTQGMTGAKATDVLSTIDLIGFGFDYMVNSNFFLEGASYWPYAGGASGYAAATLGLGLRVPLYRTLWAEGKIGAGPGAGGGLPAGSGLLAAWELGLDMKVSNRISAFADYGGLSWSKGGSTDTASLGVRFLFGIPAERRMRVL